MRAWHTTPAIANRKIPETFTLRRATRYGGFNALSDFVTAQGIDRALTDAFGRAKAPGATYRLPETLRHLLDGSLLGVERVWHFTELEQEPLLCVKRDRDRLPDHTLLYRELGRFEAAGMLSRLRAVGETLLGRALADQPWSHPGLRLDGRDGLRRTSRSPAGAQSAQAGPRVVSPAAVPRAQEWAHGPPPAGPGRHGLGARGRRVPHCQWSPRESHPGSPIWCQ